MTESQLKSCVPLPGLAPPNFACLTRLALCPLQLAGTQMTSRTTLEATKDSRASISSSERGDTPVASGDHLALLREQEVSCKVFEPLYIFRTVSFF